MWTARSDFLPKGTVGEGGSKYPAAEKPGKRCFNPVKRVSISIDVM